MTYRFAYRRYSLAFRAPVRTAHGAWAQREGLILRFENEAGAITWGEVAPIPWFGTETVDEAEALCRSWGEKVAIDALQALPSNYTALRSGLRMVMAGELKKSTAGHAYLPVAAFLPAGREALAQVEPKAEIGFRTFKWKVGVASAADELAMLDDLLAKLPEGSKLRLDANGAWDRRTAERWLERCADRPIEFIEQPVAANIRGATDLLLGLAGDYPTPIGLDESLVVEGDVIHWLELGWSGFYIIKSALIGDLDGVLGRLSTAKSRVVFSSALETAVGAQAALRTALDFGGEARALGYGVWPLFVDSRFDGPALAPFIRRDDIERIDPDNVWNALS